MMFLLKKPRLLLAGAALIGLIVLVYMWRGDIIKGAENAYKAIMAQNVIESNENSRKGADNVKREEQGLDDSSVNSELCKLGIVYEYKGCDGY